MGFHDDIRVHGAAVVVIVGIDGHVHRPQSEACEQRLIPLRVRIARGQQFLAVEDRVGTRQEAQRLQLVAHLLASRRETHHRLRHQHARDRDGAHEFERIERLRAVQRGAFHLHQAIDRHRIRVRRQVGQGAQEARALAPGLAQADDAAAAGLHAGIAHVFERVQAVLDLAGVDDRVVELRIGVDVVVVVVEPGGLECRRLLAAEHAQRGAGLEAERLHFADHRGDLGDVAVLGRTPRRAHAEARGTGGLGLPGLLQHRLGAHQLRGIDPGVVALRLRTVGTVLRAAAGLDRQQGADLHLGRVEAAAVDLGGAEQQLRERQVEQRLDLAQAPVVAGRRGRFNGGLAGRAERADGGHRHSLTDMRGVAGQSGKHAPPCQPDRRPAS